MAFLLAHMKKGAAIVRKCTRRVIVQRKFTTGSGGGGKGQNKARERKARLSHHGDVQPQAHSSCSRAPQHYSLTPRHGAVPHRHPSSWPRDDSTRTSPPCTSPAPALHFPQPRPAAHLAQLCLCSQRRHNPTPPVLGSQALPGKKEQRRNVSAWI